MDTAMLPRDLLNIVNDYLVGPRCYWVKEFKHVMHELIESMKRRKTPKMHTYDYSYNLFPVDGLQPRGSIDLTRIFDRTAVSTDSKGNEIVSFRIP